MSTSAVCRQSQASLGPGAVTVPPAAAVMRAVTGADIAPPSAVVCDVEEEQPKSCAPGASASAKSPELTMADTKAETDRLERRIRNPPSIPVADVIVVASTEAGGVSHDCCEGRKCTVKTAIPARFGVWLGEALMAFARPTRAFVGMGLPSAWFGNGFYWEDPCAQRPRRTIIGGSLRMPRTRASGDEGCEVARWQEPPGRRRRDARRVVREWPQRPRGSKVARRSPAHQSGL